jgi:hypothetical protein
MPPAASWAKNAVKALPERLGVFDRAFFIRRSLKHRSFPRKRDERII